MSAAHARLRFDRVACLRGARLLFEDLSFALGPGDAALVTGPNGVGKSSLLRIAAGLLAPAAGRIEHGGGIALANEATALDPQKPLGQALAFWARIDGRGAGDVLRGLEAMGIANLAEVPVRMLSTGQRKRAALAGTIAGGAGVWLLDEPGNGLDTASLERLATAMAAHRAGGGIVLAASHQPLGLADAQPITLAPVR
ncbi:MAG: heme exporter protein CcmA [Sphingomonas bacterium]|nr:heme exporter protein CcmA [Sphingomonas bacterium]